MLPHLSRRPRKAVVRSLILAVATLPVLAAGVVAAPAANAVLPTTTTVSASPTSIDQGEPVTLTATVGIQGIGGLLLTPSSEVSFSASTGGPAVALGTAQLASGCLLTFTNCTATLTTTQLPLGEVTVTATYGGDSIASPSSGTTRVSVSQAEVPANAPAAPTLSASDLIGAVRLEWTTSDDGGSPVTGYRLYRSTSAGSGYQLITTDLPSGHYDDTTGAVGTTYYYKATAVNAAGESGFSNVASGTPRSLPSSGNQRTYDVTQCTPDAPCTGRQLSRSAPGSKTEVTASTTASEGPHTLTSAIGGEDVEACASDYAGYSATFNDTSTDAYKEILVHLTGQDAEDTMALAGVSNEYDDPTDPVGCLGLGTPWETANGPAVWSPADGLYVGTPNYCSQMESHQDGPDEFSQPCTELGVYWTSGKEIDWHVLLTFELPPGDGVISGSRCC